jgi:hypothetical protein
MDIMRMHDMIEKLSECAKCEIDKGIENIDPCEMGQVTDMMKDLAEAMYYRTLMKAMEESSADETMEMFERFGDGRRFYDNYRYSNGRFAPKGRGTRRGYVEPPYYHQMPEDYHEWERMPEYDRMRDLDRMSMGKMYYSEPMSGNNGMSTGTHDAREGRAGMSRRSYMQTKEMHNGNSPEDKDAKMKELEKYMKSLSEDVTELLSGMSPEEKQLTKTKLTTLVTKM